MIDFASATRGHQIKIMLKGKRAGRISFPFDKLECSCGWMLRRPRVLRANDKGKPVSVLLPMDEFRGEGDKHLYLIWKDAQQGRLA